MSIAQADSRSFEILLDQVLDLRLKILRQRLLRLLLTLLLEKCKVLLKSQLEVLLPAFNFV